MRIFLASIFIFILGLFGLFNPVRNLFHFVFAPVQYGLRSIAQDIRGTAEFFVTLGEIRSENLKLLGENEALKSKILDLQLFEQENIALKEQLHLRNKNSFDKDLLVANVLGNSTDLTGSSIFLDKGSRQNVKVGSNVIKGNYLVGIVRSVSLERSIVDLITSPNVSITVVDIDAKEKTSGLATGQYGTSIVVSRIFPGEPIAQNDTILTSGKDGKFQPNLIVGRVAEITQTSAEPLKSASVETLIDLSKLDKVFVIVE